jgi:hypothetical protein
MRARRSDSFRQIEKDCLFCGKRLKLNTTRDIERKKFCSHRCTTSWRRKNDGGLFIKGSKLSEESKQKMRESKLRLLKKGWKPIGGSKYKGIKTAYGKYRFRSEDGSQDREHRILLKDRLKPGDVVHHRDGNRGNNALSNLQIMTHKEHRALHAKLTKEKYLAKLVS